MPVKEVDIFMMNGRNIKEYIKKVIKIRLVEVEILAFSCWEDSSTIEAQFTQVWIFEHKVAIPICILIRRYYVTGLICSD
jgi:hypothetical protein